MEEKYMLFSNRDLRAMRTSEGFLYEAIFIPEGVESPARDVDDETPSFAISLYKKYRGQGIGTRLIKKMLVLLKEKGYKRASQAVQKANYTVRMYEKVGFKTVDENDEEYIMVCEL